MTQPSHVKVYAAASVTTIHPACNQGVCADGEPQPALFLLPQVVYVNEEVTYVWVPVCSGHANGWWEDADEAFKHPRGYRLVPLATGEGLI